MTKAKRVGAGTEAGREEAAALLALRRLPDVGDVRCLRLLGRCGSARGALRAALADRGSTALDERDWAHRQLDRAVALGAHFIPYYDDRYPEQLRQIHDAPAYLFVRGRPELLQASGVAIVGSRRSTTYGRDVARRFGRDLAARGLVVTSGLARGIDAAAHEGALAAGDTVAVLGTGADVVYPRVNRALYERVAIEGAVVSELPLGAGPEAGSFPRRNRIISGLSLGVVVAEAPARSGALITARCAAEQGRDVFAVPGEVTNRRCAGCLELLRDGACLARGADDVIDEMWAQLPRHLHAGTPASAPTGSASTEVDAEAQRLLALLETGARHVDALTRDSGLPPARVLAVLLQMELVGEVEAQPGGVYGRRRR